MRRSQLPDAGSNVRPFPWRNPTPPPKKNPPLKGEEGDRASLPLESGANILACHPELYFKSQAYLKTFLAVCILLHQMPICFNTK